VVGNGQAAIVEGDRRYHYVVTRKADDATVEDLNVVGYDEPGPWALAVGGREQGVTCVGMMGLAAWPDGAASPVTCAISSF
jgi:hypothetical protein